ncbi:hypothetical protein EIP91_011068 [Steccherinum ochraceum]|uniref:Mitochondrial protein n=1 Tax=Steccherinum ochraceum TaxID=92696 RepID=A0A4V2MXS8_9APHY|nr:hypothetical protein EIP91_011068 [Steccherinum ochraceum]
MIRGLARFHHPTAFASTSQPSRRVCIPQRCLHTQIVDPPRASVSGSGIRMAHPKDPASTFSATTSQPSARNADPESTGPVLSTAEAPTSPSPPPLPSTPSDPPLNSDTNDSFLPVPANLSPVHTDSPFPGPSGQHHHRHANPPFHTHRFVVELEKSFPTPTARSLMRAIRALLVDRIGKVKRDALTSKDLESQAYLFRAALSELRTEMTMRTRNGSAAMRTATSALRREVDALDGHMKEDLANLKHEIQIDLDSRKNEAKNDLKRQAIQHEELLNKSLITLGELRTLSEEVRWDNMRNSVTALGAFLLVIVLSMEFLAARGKKEVPPPPPPPPEVAQLEGEGLQKMNWVT